MNLIDVVKDLGNSDNDNDNDIEEYVSFLDDLIGADYLDPDDFMRHTSDYDTEEFLKIMHFNMDNITTKMDSFINFNNNQLCLNNDPFFDLIAVSETHLRAENGKSNSSSLSDLELKTSLPGYQFIGKSRVNLKKGGVGIFIKDILFDKVSVEDRLCVFDEGIFESLFVKIACVSQKPTVLGVVYLPNGIRTNKDLIFRYLDEIMEIVQRKDYNLVLVGDMNIDLMKCRSDESVANYMDNQCSNGMKFRQVLPTRVTHTSATLIDHVLDNLNNEVQLCGVITTQLHGSHGHTDHLPTYVIIKQPKPTKTDRTVTKRFYNSTNCALFKQKLENEDFTSSFVEDPNTAMTNLMKTIVEIHEQSFPLKTTKTKHYDYSNKDFMTPGLLKSCKQRDKLYKSIVKNKISRDSNFYRRYIGYRNLLNSLIKKQKKKHYDELLTKNKHDVKRTIDLVNKMINKSNDKHSITSAKFRINGVMTDNKNEIAHGFNKFFSEIGPKTNQKVGLSHHDSSYYLNKKTVNGDPRFRPKQVSPDFVLETCKGIAKKTSTDHYGISQKLIVSNLASLAPVIAHIWNKSIEIGIFPDAGKIAKVIPIFKGKGLDQCEFSNYRPISLLPIISKILERIMCAQLTEYLNTNKILFESQYGFRKGHNTDFATMDFIADIATSVDKGEFAFGIFIDLSKAFDTINHRILLQKLKWYGIKDEPLAWFESYLNGRQQYVEFDGVKSEMLPNLTGVPQGSVLGPLLFLLYVNDLPCASDLVKMVLFADDSNLLLKGKKPEDIKQLANGELEKIQDWFAANKLLLNADKTKLIVFSSRKCRAKPQDISITLNGTVIRQVEHETFLGLELDETLKWYSHTEKIANCISKKIGMLARIKKMVSPRTLKLLYNCFILPNFTYGIPLWGGTFDKGLNRLEKLQKKAIRIITRARYMDHSEPRQKDLEILKIKDLYKMRTNCLTYDCLFGNAPEKFCNLFIQNTERDMTNTRTTRSNSSRPHDIRPCQIISNPGPVSKSCFFFTAIDFWNELPLEIKTSSSKDQFKNRLKKYYLSSYQTTIACRNPLCGDIRNCRHTR